MYKLENYFESKDFFDKLNSILCYQIIPKFNCPFLVYEQCVLLPTLVPCVRVPLCDLVFGKVGDKRTPPFIPQGSINKIGYLC